jgi:hypothetical protein
MKLKRDANIVPEHPFGNRDDGEPVHERREYQHGECLVPAPARHRVGHERKVERERGAKIPGGREGSYPSPTVITWRIAPRAGGAGCPDAEQGEPRDHREADDDGGEGVKRKKRR